VYILAVEALRELEGCVGRVMIDADSAIQEQEKRERLKRL